MRPIKAFIAYAREDRTYVDTLLKFLTPLRKSNRLKVWYDGEIIPGTEWEQDIKNHLGNADIILLLMSAESLSSDYFYDQEMTEALKRHESEKAIVIPVILRYCSWEDTPMYNLQALPDSAKPVKAWTHESAAYKSIVDGIKDAMQLVKEREEAIEEKKRKEEEERKRLEAEEKKRKDEEVRKEKRKREEFERKRQAEVKRQNDIADALSQARNAYIRKDYAVAKQHAKVALSLDSTNTEAQRIELETTNILGDKHNKQYKSKIEITKIFIAYAREDEPFLHRLREYLTPLERKQIIETSYDGKIVAGDRWDEKIKTDLKEADLILLLVSAKSLTSYYFYNEGIRDALARHMREEAIAIPVILKHCGWQVTDLNQLQALPKDAKPITAWDDESAAYNSVLQGIYQNVQIIEKRKKAEQKHREDEAHKLHEANEKKRRENEKLERRRERQNDIIHVLTQARDAFNDRDYTTAKERAKVVLSIDSANATAQKIEREATNNILIKRNRQYNKINKTKVFIAYARADEPFLLRLREYLAPLERNQAIEVWYDGKIEAGEQWGKKIKTHLHAADLILLLVSAKSLASNYFYNEEVKDALARHEHKEAIVLPVILKHCGWHMTELGKLQALPKDAKPITTWADESSAYNSVLQGIHKNVRIIRERKKSEQQAVQQKEQKHRKEDERKRSKNFIKILKFALSILVSIAAIFGVLYLINNYNRTKIKQPKFEKLHVFTRFTDLRLINHNGKSLIGDHEQFEFVVGTEMPKELSTANNKFLDQVAAYLKANPIFNLKLTGKYLRNEKNISIQDNMGVARAATIRSLLKKRGITADRIRLDGQIVDSMPTREPVSFNLTLK